MDSAFDLILFLTNSIAFTLYETKYLNETEYLMNVSYKYIGRKVNENLLSVFFDSAIFSFYLATILEKIPISVNIGFYFLQILFIFSQIYKIDIKEKRKYFTIKISHLFIIGYYTFGRDPFLSFILRFLNNFFSTIIWINEKRRITKIEKSQIIYKSSHNNQ